MRTATFGNTQIDLPEWLETRVEKDILVAYPPGTDYVNLRLTLITVSKDGKELPIRVEKEIKKVAKESGARLRKQPGKVWFYATTPCSEGSPGSLMHWWYIGMGGHLMVISCFCDVEEKENVLTKRVLASVEPMIQSFRRNLEKKGKQKAKRMKEK